MEKWRPAYQHEDRYEVSDQGRVRSLDTRDAWGRLRRGRVLKPFHAGEMSYEYVSLYTGKQRRGIQRTVHSLVLETFVGPRPPGLWCRHLNGVHLDNRLENLSWGTPRENVRDTVSHGHHRGSLKTHCLREHPLEEPNLVPSQLRRGVRSCRACNLAHATAHKRGEKFSKELADEKYAEVIRRHQQKESACLAPRES